MKIQQNVLRFLLLSMILWGCGRSSGENPTPPETAAPLSSSDAPTIQEDATSTADVTPLSDPDVLPIEEEDLPAPSTLIAQPAVAAPGETIAFNSPDLLSGELRVNADLFDTIPFTSGTAQLLIPENIPDGRYYASLILDGIPVAYASFRVASQAGVWLSADRSFSDGVQATTLYVRAYNLPEGVLAGIFVSQTQETDPTPYVPDENGALTPGSLVPLEQIVDRPLVLPAGIHGSLVAQVEPDYYAESQTEETVWQSEAIDLEVCTEPVTLSGSLDGRGLANVVWADGVIRSRSQFVEDGDFRFAVRPGFVLLQRLTWTDSEQAKIDNQLVFLDCGQDIRVEASSGMNVDPKLVAMDRSTRHHLASQTVPKLLFRPARQAGGNDPCRKAFIFPIVTVDGELDVDLSQAAGLALKTAIISLVPRIEVATFSDFSALIQALAEAQLDEDVEAEISALEAIAQAGDTDFIVGLTSAKLGNSFPVALSGQAQRPGDASVRGSGSGSSSSLISPSFAAYQTFAEDLSHAAICGTVEPESKKVALGEEVEIDYFVTDLTGEPLDGAEVSISNPACGELEPRDGSTESGLFETTYTFPDDQTCVENLDFASEWGGPSGSVKTSPRETIVHLYPEPITMQIYVGHEPTVGATSNIVGAVIPSFPPRPFKTAPGSLPRFQSTGTCGALEGGKEVVNDNWFVRDEFDAQRAEASVNITPVIQISPAGERTSSEEAGNDRFVISFVNKAVGIPPRSDGLARSTSAYSGNYVDWLSGEGFPGTIFLIDIKNPDKLPNFKPVLRWDAQVDQWGESGGSYEVIVMYKPVSCSNPLSANGLGNMLTTGQGLILLSDADGGKRSGEFTFPEIKDERYQIALYALNVASAGSIQDDEIGMYTSGMTRLKLLLDIYLQQEVSEQ